jgi:hypothetical protein
MRLQVVAFEVVAQGAVSAYAHVTGDKRRPHVAASPAGSVEKWANTELTAALRD